MKKSLAFALISAIILSLTACNTYAPEKSPEETIAETTASLAVTTTPIVTTIAETAPAPAKLSEYIDENGLITAEGIAQIDRIFKEKSKGAESCYCALGLFDFDRDGVPEINIVKHNGSQGEMPIDIFTMDGEPLGSFQGYCLDGFCRMSYGENCVYVHNSYEHSAQQKADDVQKLTFEDGKILTETVFEEKGYAVERFPLMNYYYYINGENVDEAAYFNKYNNYLYDNEYMRAREANEFSICSFDMKITDESRITETVCGVYNSYVSGRNAAKELFENEPEFYSFDDFDNDGRYEAFVLESHSTTDWHFWNGKKIIEAEISAKLGCLDYTRCGGFLIAQPFSNGTPCYIFGVKNGEPYTHPMSGCGMMIRPHSSSARMDVQAGIFVLYKSRYNASSPGGSHTWTPYFFNYGLEELESIPVTREYFSDRPDVQAEFEAIEAEAKAEDGKIGNAFLRGDIYLNVNYTTPIFAENENGNEIAAADRNHYKTFAILPDDVVLIDEGRGVYTASIKDN